MVKSKYHIYHLNKGQQNMVLKFHCWSLFFVFFIFNMFIISGKTLIFRNKKQKRVTALNRELPPRNEQFLLDFGQLQSQFAVSSEF